MSTLQTATAQSVRCDCCHSTTTNHLFNEGGFELIRCRTCQLAYVANPPDVLIWQGSEEHYVAADDTPQLPSLTRELEAVLPFAKPGKWLDIGCGQGALLGLVLGRGFDPYGIEVDKLRGGIAKERFPGRVFDKSVEELGLEPASFAVISALNVFSHLRSPLEFFRLIKPLLASDGVLLLSTGELGPGIKRQHSHFWDLGDHLQFLGPGTLKRYCQQTGYEMVLESRIWAPDWWSSREFLAFRGRSRLRNALKSAIIHVPGLYALFRLWFLRRHRDSAKYLCTFVLKPIDA